MKGIILAGGAGSRLYPATMASSKQMLPVYDKPMVYYSLSTLMLAEIRDILIISTPWDLEGYKKLLGNGERFGIRLTYKEQSSPDGLPQAFIIGKEFISDDRCALILGDNIFYGQGLKALLMESAADSDGATIFGYRVEDPQRFGVVEFTSSGQVLSVEEKPVMPKTDIAVTGLYFYDRKVVEYAESLSPSARGELEITDLNRIYLKEGKLKLKLMGPGFAWFDTGTPDSMMTAGEFVRLIERHQQIKIGVPEEIAYRQKWINKETLLLSDEKNKNSSYHRYLKRLVCEPECNLSGQS